MPDTSASHKEALRSLASLVATVEQVFHGKRDVVRLATAALLARGHLLLEDVPGVGKTTLAHAFARALGLRFRRIQFTSDLLPSDVLGVSVYNPNTASFETREGPIFTNIVLADEINRAPPRTQSGLLQAMQERAVTIDGITRPLPDPFLVVATQNPFEHHGTYPLPESQLDRFLMRLSIGYPDPEAERRILEGANRLDDPVDSVEPAFGVDRLGELQAMVPDVHVDEGVVDYVMEIVGRTRNESRVQLGVSPRGAIALLSAARAYALVRGREYVVPDDVRDLVIPCLAHRLVATGAGGLSGAGPVEAEAILTELLLGVPVPV